MDHKENKTIKSRIIEMPQIDPHSVTVVGSKHPLARRLCLNRNETIYSSNDPIVIAFKEEGQLHPVALFPWNNPKTGNEFIVAAGNQRTLMARAAGMKLDAVLHLDWTIEDAERIAIIENAHRAELSDQDLMTSVQRAVERHTRLGTKAKIEIIAKEFNRTYQWVYSVYNAARLPLAIREHIPDLIPLTAASEIAKEKTVADQLVLFEKLRNYPDNLGNKKVITTELVKALRKGATYQRENIHNSADRNINSAKIEILQAELNDAKNALQQLCKALNLPSYFPSGMMLGEVIEKYLIAKLKK